MPIKIMFIFGTRPEAIKLIPVIKEMQANKNLFDIKICITAQHREMLDLVLKDFDIKPDYDLDIMQKEQSLFSISSKILLGLEKILKNNMPDMILVHGDTTTTFIGALAAFYNKIKIVHIEAGLRSYNKFEPFPEEINRKLVTQMADLYFAPTSLAKENLIKENINPENVFITGNTAIDNIKANIKKDYVFKNKLLAGLDFDNKNKKIIVITAHRRENFGLPLKNICEAILKLSNNKNLEFIYAVHPNPKVKDLVYDILNKQENIYLLSPLDIKDMHNLIYKSFLVMTDSGGLQEEVPALNKPVLVLRNVTERQEGLLTGALKLVGTEQDNIIKCVNDLINNHDKYKLMADAKNPFGDGLASKRICQAILFYFGLAFKPKDFVL